MARPSSPSTASSPSRLESPSNASPIIAEGARSFARSGSASRPTRPPLLQRADIPDQGPAILLGEMLPWGHGAPAVRDLPEDLAVAFVLHALRGPVRRLRVERDGRRAVPLALRAVTGHAVDLGQLFPLLDELLVVRQRVLFHLLRIGSNPGSRTLS